MFEHVALGEIRFLLKGYWAIFRSDQSEWTLSVSQDEVVEIWPLPAAILPQENSI